MILKAGGSGGFRGFLRGESTNPLAAVSESISCWGGVAGLNVNIGGLSSRLRGGEDTVRRWDDEVLELELELELVRATC